MNVLKYMWRIIKVASSATASKMLEYLFEISCYFQYILYKIWEMCQIGSTVSQKILTI